MTKGQMAMVGVMIAVLLFIFALVLIEPIKEQTTQARNTTNLDCTNNSISTGNRMACIAVDWYLPGFIGICIAVALAYIGLRKLRQGADQQ